MQDENENIVVGIYVRVSTIDQSREGHSIDEQKDYLKRFCEFNGYKIYKYYEDPAYTGKNTNRPSFNKMMEDAKAGKINKILVYKFDRLTRSAVDMEEICNNLNDYNCSLESSSEKIDTSTAMGKFFRRIMIMIAQWEVETISERTIFGLEGAAKKGHFSGQAPLGYDKVNKKLVINELEAEVVKRIFYLYVKGNSVCSIVKLFNKENVLNRIWKTTAIDRMLSNYLYIGCCEHRRRTTKPIIFEDVCPAIIDKKIFDIVQKQKEKNLRNYKRKHTYIFMQSVVCHKCGKFMGGSSSASGNKEKHIYYRCHNCKTRIAETKLEKPLINFLNDMLDYFLLIDNTFKPYLNKDVDFELNRYIKLLEEVKTKEKRLKKAFIDGYVKPQDFQPELDSITSQINDFENKITELKDTNDNLDNRDSLRLISNLKELERQKYKSHYARKNGLWDKLSKEQKHDLISKYIESIEVEKIKDGEVVIHNINIKKAELENIGYMFRNDCFDMVVNIDEQDVLLSNYKTDEEIDEYVKALSEFYKVTKLSTTKELLDINEFLGNKTLQIIPNKKTKKLDKEVYTILQIS